METLNTRKPYSTVGATTPTQVSFTQAYIAELNGWKKRRPQWKKLCAAIRNEAPKDEIYGLAADAGATINELWDLQNIFRRGRDSKAEAGRLDKAERAFSDAEKRLQAATKQLDKKGLSINEQDNARIEHEAAFFEHERAKLAVVGPRQAAQTLALAKSENLI